MLELNGAVGQTRPKSGFRAGSKPLHDLLVADAPPHADEVAGRIKPLPGWIRLATVGGISILLWAAVIWAGAAIFAR